MEDSGRLEELLKRERIIRTIDPYNRSSFEMSVKLLNFGLLFK